MGSPGIPQAPNLRTNIDYVFILREPYIGNRKRIYENDAGMFPTFEMFCTFMDQCTENFECLVICNNVNSNKLEDQVFWYKATPHQDFRLCNPEFWAHSAAHHREEGEDGGTRGKTVEAVGEIDSVTCGGHHKCNPDHNQNWT